MLEVVIDAPRDGDHAPQNLTSIWQVNQVRLNKILIIYDEDRVTLEVQLVEFVALLTKLLKSEEGAPVIERMTFSGDVFNGIVYRKNVALELFDISEREYIKLTISREDALELHQKLLSYIKLIVADAGKNIHTLADLDLLML